MPELNIPRGYTDGEALLETDLDNIKTAVTTLNNTTKYDGDNIQTDAITAAKIINGTVTTAILGAGSITTNKIDDLNITTAKILDGEIETRAIADLAVTTSKILDANITSSKFDTSTRIAAIKFVTKSVFTGDASSATVITNAVGTTTIATVSITADTGPCLIILQPYSTSSNGNIQIDQDNGTTGGLRGTFYIKKNGSTIATRVVAYTDSLSLRKVFAIPLSTISIVQSSLSNGDSITFSVENTIAYAGTATGSITIAPCKLYVIEL